MWSLPSRRMRRSSVCTRQWTSPWSTCSCTSACSCTARFADGTAMHTLTNTRPTDRHTCTYRLIKPRVSSTRIFFSFFFSPVSFFHSSLKTTFSSFPWTVTSRRRKSWLLLLSFPTPKTLCTDIYINKHFVSWQVRWTLQEMSEVFSYRLRRRI